MIKIITFITILVCSIMTAQTNYETEMKSGMTLWQSGKTTEAVATFEKLAIEQKDNWLPNYYVALVNTLSFFQAEDKENSTDLLDAAQKALDIELKNDSQNAELLVLQGMIYTGWIVSDPITYGMKYSAITKSFYVKAEILAPENPRVMFSKAEFEMGSAKYFGQDTAPMCEQIAKSIPLFENFKPKSPFHPNWGLERAKEVLTNCK